MLVLPGIFLFFSLLSVCYASQEIFFSLPLLWLNIVFLVEVPRCGIKHITAYAAPDKQPYDMFPDPVQRVFSVLAPFRWLVVSLQWEWVLGIRIENIPLERFETRRRPVFNRRVRRIRRGSKSIRVHVPRQSIERKRRPED